MLLYRHGALCYSLVTAWLLASFFTVVGSMTLQDTNRNAECAAINTNIHKALANATDVSWFSQKLEEKGLISSQAKNAVTYAGYSNGEKVEFLLNHVKAQVNTNPIAFSILCEILLTHPSLQPHAAMLSDSYRKSN